MADGAPSERPLAGAVERSQPERRRKIPALKYLFLRYAPTTETRLIQSASYWFNERASISFRF
jgi:hypothetical protein